MSSFALIAALASSPPLVARAEMEITVGLVAGAARTDEHLKAEAVVRAVLDRSRGELGAAGVKVTLATYPDDCTAVGGATTAGKLVARGAQVVIGHACSAGAIAAAAVYARNGIVMIAAGPRAPQLTDQRAGATIFRLAGRDDRFGAETALLIATRFKERGVAIAHDKSVQGRGLADAVDRELRAQGVVPALREAYTSGEREYNGLAERIRAVEAGVVVVPAQPIEAGILFRRLREVGSRAVLLGSEALALADIETAARDAGGDLIVMLPWPSRRSNEAGLSGDVRLVQAAFEVLVAALITSRISAAGGSAAGGNVASGSAPGAIMAGGGKSALAAALASTDMPTSIGRVLFDVKGDALLPSFAPHTWRDGRWQLVEP